MEVFTVGRRAGQRDALGWWNRFNTGRAQCVNVLVQDDRRFAQRIRGLVPVVDRSLRNKSGRGGVGTRPSRT